MFLYLDLKIVVVDIVGQHIHLFRLAEHECREGLFQEFGSCLVVLLVLDSLFIVGQEGGEEVFLCARIIAA